MRELSVRATVEIAPTANLTEAVWTNAEETPDHVLFSRRIEGAWVNVTAAEFRRDVVSVAKGLIACGIAPGDRVAIMSRTRYEWTLFDYAIWTAGAISVPLYETSSSEQIAWCLSDSGAVAAVVETPEHAATVASVRADLPELRTVWQLDDDAVGTLASLGRDVTDDDVERRRSTLGRETLATVIYTSGTTGHPKGCELTHGNLLFEVRTAAEGLGELFNASASTLLFLPLAHVFARAIQVGAVECRTLLAHSGDVKHLVDDFAAFQPTFVLSVPRVFEKVYNAAKHRAHADGKGRVFDLADRAAVAYSRSLDTGGPNLLLRAEHALFERLVYGKIRAALGGRCTAAISGGAPLGDRLGHFFRGVGVTVYEGYGLTETTAGACLNLEGAVKIGTVGRPIPGVSVRIADDGEILIKGPILFRAYWRNEQGTREALTPDGWFRTGDLGDIDDDGFVKITGRKKEVIVTAGGKNVVPSLLEDRLRAHVLISNCMVVGDGQPFIGCLITLDHDALPAWKERHGKAPDASVEQLREDPELTKEIQEAVDDANKAVSRAEAIRKFRILANDFTVEGGELTPSLKVKRTVVLKEYADEVAAIYG